MQEKHEKDRTEVQSLISGEGYVSPGKLEQGLDESEIGIDYGQKTQPLSSSGPSKAELARRDKVIGALDDINFDAPSMDKDSEFANAQGQTLEEYEGSFPDFTNMGGQMRTEGRSIDSQNYNAGFRGTAEQNISLLNAATQEKFQNLIPGSSLGASFDFNKAQAGEYDSDELLYGFNDEKEMYTTYSDTGEVMEGLYGGKNYYPSVSLEGQGLREMWDTLGVGNWENRGTMWKQYQESPR
jgi:hypothetical protein